MAKVSKPGWALAGGLPCASSVEGSLRDEARERVCVCVNLTGTGDVEAHANMAHVRGAED
eukprot:5145019-Prymnesium_polylepis.1